MFVILIAENRLMDAELLYIGYALTTILPALHKGNVSIRINHTHILQAILINHNVPPEKYNEIFASMLDFVDQKLSKYQLCSKVQFSLGLSKHNSTNLIDTLLTELPLGVPRFFHNNGIGFRSIMKGHSEASKMARSAMEDVNQIVSLAQSLGVECPITLYPGLSVGYELAKNGGIIWQLVGNFNTKSRKGLPSVLGYGGRYDYMLSEFQ